MEQDSGRSVIIIGAGIAGLSAALAMRQAGWQVSVFEQAPKLEAMGAAISLWPNAIAALHRLGCGAALRDAAQPLDHVILAEQSGRVIGGFQVSRVMSGVKGVMITRTALQSLLVEAAAGIPLALGHRLSGWQDEGSCVSVRFENGVEARADLLIAADGIWSAVGQAISGVKARHAGYGGLLGLSGGDECETVRERGVEYWGHGVRMGVFDIAGGARYWFYMKNEAGPADSARLTRGDVAQVMAEGWPQDARDAVAKTGDDHTVPFSIHAKPPPRRLGHGRIILAGDAAHPMEPNLGQGACQALEDAVALGAAAHDGSPELVLRRYTKMRLRRVRRFVAYSRQGSMVAHRLPAALRPFALAIARHVFVPLSSFNIRRLYTLPDYASAA